MSDPFLPPERKTMAHYYSIVSGRGKAIDRYKQILMSLISRFDFLREAQVKEVAGLTAALIPEYSDDLGARFKADGATRVGGFFRQKEHERSLLQCRPPQLHPTLYKMTYEEIEQKLAEKIREKEETNKTIQEKSKALSDIKKALGPIGEYNASVEQRDRIGPQHLGGAEPLGFWRKGFRKGLILLRARLYAIFVKNARQTIEEFYSTQSELARAKDLYRAADSGISTFKKGLQAFKDHEEQIQTVTSEPDPKQLLKMLRHDVTQLIVASPDKIDQIFPNASPEARKAFALPMDRIGGFDRVLQVLRCESEALTIVAELFEDTISRNETDGTPDQWNNGLKFSVMNANAAQAMGFDADFDMPDRALYIAKANVAYLSLHGERLLETMKEGANPSGKEMSAPYDAYKDENTLSLFLEATRYNKGATGSFTQNIAALTKRERDLMPDPVPSCAKIVQDGALAASLEDGRIKGWQQMLRISPGTGIRPSLLPM